MGLCLFLATTSSAHAHGEMIPVFVAGLITIPLVLAITIIGIPLALVRGRSQLRTQHPEAVGVRYWLRLVVAFALSVPRATVDASFWTAAYWIPFVVAMIVEGSIHPDPPNESIRFSSLAWVLVPALIIGTILVSNRHRYQKKTRPNQPPLPTPGKCPSSSHDQVPGAADL